MKTYQTKDTSEALVLRMVGIRETEPCVAIFRSGKDYPEWTFTFEDTQERRNVSNAFFAQFATRQPLTANSEQIAQAVSVFVGIRKDHFRNADNLPKRYVD